jgi:tetratricopeptide (TPR) repeat protein
MSPAGSKLTTVLACLIALWSIDAFYSTIHAEVVTLGNPPAKLPDTGALLQRAIALAAANKATEADDAYKVAVKAAEQPDSDAKGLADILYWQSVFLRDQHRFDEASAAAERAIRIYQEKLGPDSARTAIMHGLLGSIALWQYQPSKAEPHFRAVLEAYRLQPSKEFDIVTA